MWVPCSPQAADREQRCEQQAGAQRGHQHVRPGQLILNVSIRTDTAGGAFCSTDESSRSSRLAVLAHPAWVSSPRTAFNQVAAGSTHLCLRGRDRGPQVDGVRHQAHPGQAVDQVEEEERRPRQRCYTTPAHSLRWVLDRNNLSPMRLSTPRLLGARVPGMRLLVAPVASEPSIYVAKQQKWHNRSTEGRWTHAVAKRSTRQSPSTSAQSRGKAKSA